MCLGEVREDFHGVIKQEGGERRGGIGDYYFTSFPLQMTQPAFPLLCQDGLLHPCLPLHHSPPTGPLGSSVQDLCPNLPNLGPAAMEYTPKSILLTGGAGFIASHVAIKLVNNHPDVKVGGGGPGHGGVAAADL